MFENFTKIKDQIIGSIKKRGANLPRVNKIEIQKMTVIKIVNDFLFFKKSKKNKDKIATPKLSVYRPKELGKIKKYLLHGHSQSLIELYKMLYPSA